MGTTFVDANVQCPFYKSTAPNKIRCEGTFNNTTVTIMFREVNEAAKTFVGYCCDNYLECPQYIANLKKYD